MVEPQQISQPAVVWLVDMVSVKRIFFQLFVLPSDTKSAVTFERIELVKNKFHRLDVNSIGFHTRRIQEPNFN